VVAVGVAGNFVPGAAVELERGELLGLTLSFLHDVIKTAVETSNATKALQRQDKFFGLIFKLIRPNDT
jgi:hypothetical protein